MTDRQELIDRARQAVADGAINHDLLTGLADAIEALAAEVDVLEDDVLRFLQMRNASVFAVQCALKYEDPKRMLSEWLIAGGFGTEINHELLYVEATDD